MGLAPAREPGGFGLHALDHLWPAQESPVLAGLYLRTSTDLPALRANLALRAAGVSAVFAPAWHAPFSGGNLALALRAETSSLSTFQRSTGGVGTGFQELQAPGRRCGWPSRELRNHVCHRPLGVDPVLANGAFVWHREGIHSLPELPAARLAQSTLHLAAIPAGRIGLCLGASLFLASTSLLGLED